MHVGNKGDILTTVRLQDELFEAFKKEALRNRITNRNLIERAMYLYLTDPEFKKIINNQLSARYTKPTE